MFRTTCRPFLGLQTISMLLLLHLEALKKPGGKVHHGFFNAYNNTIVRLGILDGVNKAIEMYGDLDIMVTGHSMGGAMAAFCGLDLAVTIISPSLNLTVCGLLFVYLLV